MVNQSINQPIYIAL